MFYTQISTIDTQTISTVLPTLTSKPISDLTMHDFIEWFRGDLRHGFYFFYNGEQLMYVGTCRSRTITSRLIAHIDSAEHAWMNTLVARVAEAKECSYAEAATEITSSFSVKVVFTETFHRPLISDKEEKDAKISQLLQTENALRMHLSPMLNPKKAPQPIKTYLSHDEKERRINDQIDYIEENYDSAQSNLLMVHVTSWQETDTEDVLKEKACKQWKVAPKRMEYLRYLAMWHYDSVKAVWAIEGQMIDRSTMRYSFDLGENVTASIAPKITEQLPTDHRMYSVLQYFNVETEQVNEE